MGIRINIKVQILDEHDDYQLKIDSIQFEEWIDFSSTCHDEQAFLSGVTRVIVCEFTCKLVHDIWVQNLDFNICPNR